MKVSEKEKSKAWGYFDGTCQGNPSNVNRRLSIYKGQSTVGEGSKNKAELYALWLLLKIAMERGLNGLQVIRDSNSSWSGKMESPC